MSKYALYLGCTIQTEQYGFEMSTRETLPRLGVELVEDRASKEPATHAAADLLEMAKQRGLLLGKGGLPGNTIRIKPPMCIGRDDADFIADCLDDVLTTLGSER